MRKGARGCPEPLSSCFDSAALDAVLVLRLVTRAAERYPARVPHGLVVRHAAARTPGREAHPGPRAPEPCRQSGDPPNQSSGEHGSSFSAQRPASGGVGRARWLAGIRTDSAPGWMPWFGRRSAWCARPARGSNAERPWRATRGTTRNPTVGNRRRADVMRPACGSCCRNGSCGC